MKKVLLIDNYDSFSFNLVQYLEESGGVMVTVIKNDSIDFDQLRDYDALVISPGPGLPGESGSLMELFEHIEDMPILGVCLGLQAIGKFYGAQLRQLDKVYHGIDSQVRISDFDNPLFSTLPEVFKAGRYHSWVIDEQSMDKSSLRVTCSDESGIIMGVRHETKEIHGLQFHPESVMTPQGRKIISNFINNCIKK